MPLNQNELTEEQEDTLRGRFLTFTLGHEFFGIEIRYVTEIIGIQPVTKLPEAPDCIKGIINLRGNIIPVIDVRLKFKKPAIEYTDRTCIIVIRMEERFIGLVVDNVAEVMAISDENIVPPPEFGIGMNNYISGIGKAGNEVKLLLDCKKFFSEEKENLQKVIGG